MVYQTKNGITWHIRLKSDFKNCLGNRAWGYFSWYSHMGHLAVDLSFKPEYTMHIVYLSVVLENHVPLDYRQDFRVTA